MDENLLALSVIGNVIPNNTVLYSVWSVLQSLI